MTNPESRIPNPVSAFPNPESPIPALRIALICGEASGDLLGADLIRGLRRRYPEAVFAGLTGPAMRAEGADTWWDCQELSVMGLAEVLRHLPRLLRLRSALLQRLVEWKPHLVVGIDAPDFNLPLERKLRAHGLHTAHYVSPSLWAWRESRAAKIQHSAERILCLFPIEPAIYARYGVEASFVGHPTAVSMAQQPDVGAARQRLGLDPQARLLAILPGSRRSEIQRLAEPFLHAAALFRRQHPEFHAIVPFANAACGVAMDSAWQHTINQAPAQASAQRASMAELQQLRDGTRSFDGASHDVLIAADLVLLASGTAALETMLAKKPMVVGYRISGLTYAVVKAFGLLKVERYSLPNILAGEALVDECMQSACRGDVLADRLHALWQDEARRAALQPRYLQLHQSLLPPRDDAAAAALGALLDPTSTAG